jgi:two-component system, NarL family, sensor histidine kinase UhpB
MPRRYVPLVYRVAGMNAVLLVAAVVVTLLVLARKLSMFALDEAVILLAALGLVALVNLMILRRVVRPLEALTALARRVDLLGPGERIPHAEPTSEAGELSLTFNEMLTRLEAERREATGRVLAGQEAERLRIARELHDQVGQDLTAVPSASPASTRGSSHRCARTSPTSRKRCARASKTCAGSRWSCGPRRWTISG